MQIYNLSKTARDELIDNLAKISGGREVKPRELKIAESDDPEYTIVFDKEEKLYLGKKGDSYFPLLKDEMILVGKPVVTVDSGAVKFVCNGANVMRPGIVNIEGEFAQGDLLIVKEQKYSKPIAVGKAMVSAQEMQAASKGPVVTNLHYVGDKFWDMLKQL